MTMDPKELETIKLLTPEERFVFFMENVLEGGEVWSLCGEGWASFLDDEQGIQAFPIWSDQELASINAVGNWSGFKATPFTIQQLIEELAPELTNANIQFSVFKLLDDSGYLVEADMVAHKLKKMISQQAK